jgi:membrane-associated HD superfamily phosphohydrolase
MKDVVRISLPLILSIVFVIWVLRHRFSVLELIVVVVFCATWCVAAWMNSRILSEVFQSFWWGAVFLYSLKGDKSSGFFPMFYGAMFIFSIYILYQAFEERRRGT